MNIIKENVISQITIKKSKFIGHLVKVNSLDEINKILDTLKKEHKDATHICYAYRLISCEKAYDDGEPSGTAGIPMLDILKKYDLINTLAISIRYYGGIKLGAGGLIRAYRNSIKECIDSDKIKPYKETTTIVVQAKFEDEKKLEFLCKNYEIINKEYKDSITYKIDIEKEELNNFINAIKNTSITIK